MNVAEMCGLTEAEWRKLNIFEMGYLRSMCGLTSWNRVRNEEVIHVEKTVIRYSGSNCVEMV